MKLEKNTFVNKKMKQIVRYFRISGIPEEIIALQFDLDITTGKDILRALTLNNKLESM